MSTWHKQRRWAALGLLWSSVACAACAAERRLDSMPSEPAAGAEQPRTPPSGASDEHQPTASVHSAANGHHHQHDFSDVEHYARQFEGPERDAWQKPAEVVQLLSLSNGLVVADLGAGTGYFLPHLAAAVGESGRVLALDTEPKMVTFMRQRVSGASPSDVRPSDVEPSDVELSDVQPSDVQPSDVQPSDVQPSDVKPSNVQLSNVEVREVAADNPGLAESSVDRILIVNTWHHLSDRKRYSALLHRALRAGGQVLVVDFDEASPIGPPKSARLPVQQVIDELQSAGLVAKQASETLPYQFVVRGIRSQPEPSSRSSKARQRELVEVIDANTGFAHFTRGVNGNTLAALKATMQPGDVPHLRALLYDQDRVVVLACAKVLAEQGEPGLTALREVAADPKLSSDNQMVLQSELWTAEHP